MQTRAILSGAGLAGMVLGMLFGATVPTTMLDPPEPSWMANKTAAISQASYRFVDAGPMDLTPYRPAPLRRDRGGWAEGAVRELQQDYHAAVEQASRRRLGRLAPQVPDMPVPEDMGLASPVTPVVLPELDPLPQTPEPGPVQSQPGP